MRVAETSQDEMDKAEERGGHKEHLYEDERRSTGKNRAQGGSKGQVCSGSGGIWPSAEATGPQGHGGRGDSGDSEVTADSKNGKRHGLSRCV